MKTLLRSLFGRDKEKDKQRTEAALARTRRSWFGQVATLFRRSSIDDDLWDELEETLILGDVGVATTQKILDRLRARVRQDSVSDPAVALDLLKQEIALLLRANGTAQPMVAEKPPLTLLVVGV